MPSIYFKTQRVLLIITCFTFALASLIQIANAQQSKDATAYFNEGYTLSKSQKYAEAAEAYRQAIRLNPNIAWAQTNLSWTLLELGRYQEAADVARQAISVERDSASLSSAHNNLGFALLQTGQSEEAMSEFRQAIKIHAKTAKAYYNLANQRASRARSA